MAAAFEPQQLYGGAITVDLPKDFIDASDLRQVPDHQEVFLSQDTLTSIIFEINEFQSQAAVAATAGAMHQADESAAAYHFADPIVAPDYLSPTGIATESLTLVNPSVKKYPAYSSFGTIITPEVDKSVKSSLPIEWQQSPAQTNHEIKVHQLLIRMQDVGTDFCTRINVPMKEFQQDQETVRQEESLASEIMNRIAQTLQVNDFGLFGGET